ERGARAPRRRRRTALRRGRRRVCRPRRDDHPCRGQLRTASGVVDLGLKGRAALVCGASSGLGLARAEALAEEGANVVLFARRADQLEEHAARLGGVAVTGDVNDDGDLARAVTTVVERFGGLDVLVWNGGGPPPGTARDADEASLESAYRLLLRPAVTLVRLCLEHLERSPAGRVGAITSLAPQEATTPPPASNPLRPAPPGLPT